MNLLKYMFLILCILFTTGCGKPMVGNEKPTVTPVQNDEVWSAPEAPVEPPNTTPSEPENLPAVSPPVDTTSEKPLENQLKTTQLPATESVGLQPVAMDDAQARKINIFLSNFSESFFEHFDVQTATDEDLIRFAIRHNTLNNPKLWQTNTTNMTQRIQAKNIEKTLAKFFAAQMSRHQSIGNDILYEAGWYSIPITDGEAIPFVQVTKLEKSSEGIYTATGDVYQNANYLTRKDPYTPLKAWTKDELKEIELYGHIKATFQTVTENGISRFVLNTYDFSK